MGSTTDAIVKITDAVDRQELDIGQIRPNEVPQEAPYENAYF